MGAAGFGSAWEPFDADNERPLTLRYGNEKKSHTKISVSIIGLVLGEMAANEELPQERRRLNQGIEWWVSLVIGGEAK